MEADEVVAVANPTPQAIYAALVAARAAAIKEEAPVAKEFGCHGGWRVKWVPRRIKAGSYTGDVRGTEFEPRVRAFPPAHFMSASSQVSFVPPSGGRHARSMKQLNALWGRLDAC